MLHSVITLLHQLSSCYFYCPSDVEVPEELVMYDDIEDVYTYGSLQVCLQH
jgi:hypothetical protein